MARFAELFLWFDLADLESALRRYNQLLKNQGAIFMSGIP